jgi:hypothetical protein
MNTATMPALSRAATPEVSDGPQSGWELYRGIKNILRCDKAEVVHGIAHYVLSQHRSLRWFSTLIEQTRNTPVPEVFASLGWLQRFLSVKHGLPEEGAVWIARLSNERRAIEPFLPFTQGLKWSELRFTLLPDAAGWHALTRHSEPRRIFKLVRRLKYRYEFFRILRVVEFIGYYTRYLEIFQNGRFNLAVASNHSNPHGLAFNLAARKCGIPVVLITHGMPVRPVARLVYDLAVVHCEAARQIYEADGCRIKRVLLHGRRQHYGPMPTELPLPPLRVGIFLCKDVNEKSLQTLVTHLLSRRDVSLIQIRPHPKNLYVKLNNWVAAQNNPRVCLSSGGSVFDDIRSVDLVLAGNSSVLIDAVTAGHPAGYIPELDHGPYDLHQFVHLGLIYPIRDSNWSPDSMLRFYNAPGWPNILRHFANIDDDEATIATKTAGAIRDLLAENSSSQLPKP